MPARQLETPMTKEDGAFLKANPPRWVKKPRKGARRYKAWTQEDGWCSACLMADRKVVLFGRPDAHVGLCGKCLAFLRTTLQVSDVQGAK